jgi:hydroxymethylpyrimidine/phosphomethylpyrimidine kinase
MRRIRNILSIAGVDSSGGAGIYGDLKTISSLGCYGAAITTALTAQNTKTVKSVFPCNSEFINDQFESIFEDIKIDFVKVGMLFNKEIIICVSQNLKNYNFNKIILDPVMIAKSGDSLLDDTAIDLLRQMISELSYCVTPNIPEALKLINMKTYPIDVSDMKELTYLIHKKLNLENRWVYLKGGHLDGTTVIDLIFNGIDLHVIKSERINTKNTHGTGCTLSSALASIHANNQNFFEVAKKANDYVNKAIKNSDFLNVGSGHGPLNHFHKFN